MGRWIALSLIAVLLVSIIGSAGFAYYYGTRMVKNLQAEVAAQFKAGQSDLDAGKALLKDASTNHDPAKIDAAHARFESGRQHFIAARHLVDDNSYVREADQYSQLASYVRPRQLAVDHLAAMALAVTTAAEDGGDVDRIMVAPSAGGGSGAAKLLSVMKEIQPGLAKVKADLEVAKIAAAAVDPKVIPAGQQGVLLTTKDTIDKGIASLDEFDRLVPVLNEVMGANGPRTYLVLQLNPSELRGGGGFPGTYSLMHIDAGNMTVIKSGPTSLLQGDFKPQKGQAGYIAPPPTLVEFLGKNSWSVEDSTFFPSFQQNAQAAEGMASKLLNMQLDGVIGIDLYLVQDLLNMTGPITVTGHTVTAQNLLDTLIALGDFTYQGSAAKALVAALSGPLMQKVAATGPDHWTQLLNILNAGASQGHLLAYFNNQPAEDEMNRIGWSAQLNGNASTDFIAEIEANYGGTKANHYLTRSFDLALTTTPTGLHHKLTVHLVNQTPASIPNFYRCYIRLYVTDSATQPSITNVKADDYPNTDIPQGTKMVDGWFQINVNSRTGQGTQDTTFEWDTPLTYDGAGIHQIYWRKQPSTIQDKFKVTWTDNGRTVSADADLLQDRVLNLARGGGITVAPGNQGSAHLPSLSL